MLRQQIKRLSIKCTLSFMQEEVKSKDLLTSWFSSFVSFSLHNYVNCRSIEKNKISKSKLGFRLSKTKNISEIEQKTLVLLLIKRSTFSETPCMYR